MIPKNFTSKRECVSAGSKTYRGDFDVVDAIDVVISGDNDGETIALDDCACAVPTQASSDAK